MRAIEATFAKRGTQGRKVFIAYITAGDPSIDVTVRLVRELERNGTDIVELGVPFSDPIADGPVNQEAAQRALVSDVSLEDVLGAVREIRRESTIPVVLFTYVNSLFSYGLERFAGDAADAGVSGVLALDLPPEEAASYRQLLDGHGIDTIFLVSPVTPDERIENIAQCASGFIYYVSQMGVTGERHRVADSIPAMVRRIRAHTSIPVAVGFGVSSPDQVRDVACYADGVIVGSAIVKRIGEAGGTAGFESGIGEFVGTLTAPLRETDHEDHRRLAEGHQ